MKAFTYIQQGKFGFTEKVKPTIIDEHDAIVRVTLSSICTSDLHIKHGSVPRAVPGITVGHEMVGIVEEVGERVSHVKPGDRVTVNVETFCGECFYCKHGYVNNCTSPHGGWALGCRIDGGQTEYVRVPYATTGLNKIPDSVSDEQALFVGDILATGFWATRISEITEEDTVLIIGAGPEAKGGIDLQVLGIGQNAHIGFNEPDIKFEATTHKVKLDEETIKANSRFFENEEDVPKYAISMGIKTIMLAKKIILLASGKNKAEAIYKAVYGSVRPDAPASILQLHQDVVVIVDKDAASLLPEKDKKVFVK